MGAQAASIGVHLTACGALQGKKLIFVTNNSTKSRKGYLKKFQILGLNVSAVSWLQTAGSEGWELMITK